MQSSDNSAPGGVPRFTRIADQGASEAKFDGQGALIEDAPAVRCVNEPVTFEEIFFKVGFELGRSAGTLSPEIVFIAALLQVSEKDHCLTQFMLGFEKGEREFKRNKAAIEAANIQQRITEEKYNRLCVDARSAAPGDKVDVLRSADESRLLAFTEDDIIGSEITKKALTTVRPEPATDRRDFDPDYGDQPGWMA